MNSRNFFFAKRPHVDAAEASFIVKDQHIESWSFEATSSRVSTNGQVAGRIAARIISTDDKESSLGPSSNKGSHNKSLTKKNKNEANLSTRLKREIVRAKPTTYVDEQIRIELDAQALKSVPFSPYRLMKMPVSCREALIVLLAHSLLIYADEIPFDSARLECDKNFPWSFKFLTDVLNLLNMEASPAVSVIIEALGTTKPMMNSRSLRGCHSLSSASDEQLTDQECKDPLCFTINFFNAQPAKANLLQQCDSFQKKEISTLFNEGVRKFIEKLLSSQSGDHKKDGAGECTSKEEAENCEGRPFKTCELLEERERTQEDSIALASPMQRGQVLRVDEFCTLAGLTPPSSIAVILRDLLMMFICSKIFDARIYEVFKRTSEMLDVHPSTILIAVQDFFAADLVKSDLKDQKETEKNKTLRRLKIVAVALGIGAATALTGGMAAPAIASGFAALGVAGTSGAATFLSSLGGSAAIASFLGAGTAGLSGWKFAKRVGVLKEFAFDKVELGNRYEQHDDRPASSGHSESDEEPHGERCSKDSRHRNIQFDESTEAKSPVWIEMSDLPPRKHGTPSLSEHMREYLQHQLTVESTRAVRITPLTVTICVSGWLRSLRDICGPWTSLASLRTTEVFSLRWDPAILLDLGEYLVTLLSQKIAVTGAQCWLEHTVAAALSNALVWPVALIQYASTLDNTWLAAKGRATQAGKLLAEALCDQSIFGQRPVTLIGHSMGAKVIVRCLLELHRRKEFHLISNVVVMGTPTSSDKLKWKKIREVVAGRVLNIYSCHDWILAFLYRYMEWGVTVAGLSSIDVEGVENFDLQDLVRSHAHYADRIADILAYVGFFVVPM